jgi:peptidoglycan/LPS O-acetylase OafA/YrhL
MRVEAFTFFRFLAALIVVIFHYGKAADFKKLAPDLLSSGPQMVTFFYVLSGFVMVIAYYNKKEFSSNKFWINRIARICPVYFFALALSAYLSNKYSSLEVTPFLLNLSLLQSWFSPYPLSVNTPGWSLSVEAFFYATFPFIIIVLRNRKISPRLAIYASLCLWLVTQIILTYLYNSNFYKGFPSFSHDLIFYFPISHYCSFLVGISGAYLILEIRKSGLAERILSSAFIFMFPATLLILEYRGLIFSRLGFMIPTGSSFLAPLFLVLIMSIALSKGFLVKIFSIKPLVVLGEASYSLYILQEPIHRIYNNLSPDLELTPSMDFYLFTFILVIVSLGSFYFIEMPGKTFILNAAAYLKNRYSYNFAAKSVVDTGAES